ncbi:MAG: nucleoside hydrolase [Lachnospiraceae bacterium]
MKHLFDIPEEKRIRVIIISDAKIESDDQYAIVHALLTPRFEVEGMIASHFRNSISVKKKFVSDDTVEQSYDEIMKLLTIMHLEDTIPVLKGANTFLENSHTPQDSEGEAFIIEKCKKISNRPLYILCLGALTDLASAYLKDNDIGKKFTAVWIGGAKYPHGGNEANLCQDINAANIIFQSNILLWQITSEAYRKVRVSIAELAFKVKPCGSIGSYLYEQLVEFNNKRAALPDWPKGETWCLGDSPAISVLIDDQEGCYETKNAPFIDEKGNYIETNSDRKITVYHDIDSRFTMEDFYAKLKLYAE